MIFSKGIYFSHRKGSGLPAREGFNPMWKHTDHGESLFTSIRQRKFYVIHLPDLKWFGQFKMSGNSRKRLPWVVVCISRTSKVNIFCGLVNISPLILIHEAYHFIIDWRFNACNQRWGVGISESPVGLACYTVQTRAFSFYPTNNCWISKLVFLFLRPAVGPF